MDDSSPPGRPLSPVQRLLMLVGSAGLLLAMSADALAVLGRHAGFVVIGSIEVFQVSIVLALSSAILLVSLLNRHATVDLIIGRASVRARARLARIGYLTLAITFGLIAAGSIWVAADLWPRTEMTELLSIRLAPFRFIWITACIFAAVHFAIAFARGRRR